MSDELLQCPFCGDHPTWESSGTGIDHHSFKCRVECVSCGVEFMAYADREDEAAGKAMKQWNARAPCSTPSPDIELLTRQKEDALKTAGKLLGRTLDLIEEKYEGRGQVVVTDEMVEAAMIAHWGEDALSPRLCTRHDIDRMCAALEAALALVDGKGDGK